MFVARVAITTMDHELILALYDNIADHINRAGLRVAATARSTTDDTAAIAIYIPRPEELPTRYLRIIAFKARWRNDETIKISAVNCVLDPMEQMPVDIQSFVKNRVFRPRISIPDECELATFTYHLYDRGDKLDELAEWAVDMAKLWLYERHEFAT